MFRVSLELKRFGDLGYTERSHLQEWLENHPQALTQGDDDELLIIQKEFDGFDGTQERLDLLAIDKEGNLVIIENKLDDSGRDVVWQALKYASYCANLKKQQVVEIFQRYLNQKGLAEGQEPQDAEAVLLEFLGAEDLQSVQFNTLKSQRLILVAARFRKEVTNTVLWLSQFGIDCRCFKATVFQGDDEHFLTVEQIIPTPPNRQIARRHVIAFNRHCPESPADSMRLKQAAFVRPRSISGVSIFNPGQLSRRAFARCTSLASAV